jgi:hypothetical protein
MFARDVSQGAKTTWRVTGPRSGELQVSLDAPVAIGIARLEEDTTRGQRVSRYRLLGDDRELSSGTTIGYTKVDRFPSATVSNLRLIVETVDEPERVRLWLFGA